METASATANLLVFVNTPKKMTSLDIQIKVYRFSDGRLEPWRTAYFKDIADKYEYTRASEALREGDGQAVKQVIIGSVRRWVEEQGGTVLAVAETEEGVELFVKAEWLSR